MADRSLAVLLGLLLGLLVGVIGAFTVRSVVGVVIACLLYLAGAVFARSTGGSLSFLPYVVGAGAGLLAAAFLSFGGDLVVLLDGLTWGWLGVCAAITVGVAAAPSRWFVPESPADAQV